jgi:hypothetical protein
MAQHVPYTHNLLGLVELGLVEKIGLTVARLSQLLECSVFVILHNIFKAFLIAWSVLA